MMLIIMVLFLSFSPTHRKTPITCFDSTLSQYVQSAAPPAMVPSRNLLISMIFLTLPDPMYIPPVARESTARSTPPLGCFG